MSNLSFQYPLWYILFCVALGAGYAAILYYNDKTFKGQHPRMHQVLAALRAISGTLLAALLLSPILKSSVTEIKKPVVVIAQDQSESIGVAIKDTTLYKTNFEALANALSDKFEVHQYAFGDHVREGVNFQFKDKLTNISDLMRGVYDLYSNQNLGAVVVATDGIYNEGSSPVYSAGQLKAPIYTVALGDTTPRKDLIVKKVFHNNIAYLNDKFNIQIDVAANNCTGANTTLTVAKIDPAGNATPIQSQPISINKNDFFLTKEITLDASQAGAQRYRVTLSPVSGEATTANNTKDIFIDVLDARTKILLLANSPHPDISAINEAVSNNKNYTIAVAYLNDLKVNPADFDFVVLHQIPSITNPAEALMKTLDSKKIPRLFIVGSQSDTRRLSALEGLVAISADPKNGNDVQGVLNPSFNLFTLEPAYNEIVTYNPLSAPFGEFKELGGGQTILYQRIGKVDTKYPLITLGETNGVKTGLIAAEGIWKWRLFDYAQRQNHETFDGFLSKMIQYLTLKEDKRKFRVTLDKNVFRENESVQFNAELYNNSYELINDPDATIIITNAQSKQFNYTFNKNGKAYSLDAGVLPVGDYSYKGAVNNGGQVLTAEGKFSVQPIQAELYETTADHSSLRVLSQQSGGAMFYPNDLTKISEAIHQREMKPMMFTTNKTQSAMNLKWIFFLIAGLLSLEWFLRRYFGAY